MRPGKKVAICRAWVLAKSPGLGDEACTGRIKHTPSARAAVRWRNAENARNPVP